MMNGLRTLGGDMAGLARASSPLLQKCESPIEVAFAGAFTVAKGFEVKKCGEAWAVTRGDNSLTLVCQYELRLGDDPWYGSKEGNDVFARVDFALLKDGKPVLLIDVDGHEFHERKRSDIVRDKIRDRRIMRCGFNHVHFTSTELMDNAVGCAIEAFALGVLLGGQT